MPSNPTWEEVHKDGPVDGYACLVHRMRVPGGYIYKDTTMYLRGLLAPKFSTSMVFVPDNTGNPTRNYGDSALN